MRLPAARPDGRRDRLPRRLLADRRAATAVEYGLIAALVIITMIFSFQLLANTTVSMWGNTQSKISNATGY